MRLHITGEWQNYRTTALSIFTQAAAALRLDLTGLHVMLRTYPATSPKNWSGRAYPDCELKRSPVTNRYIKCRGAVKITCKLSQGVLLQAVIHELGHIAYCRRTHNGRAWHGNVYNRMCEKAFAICGRNKEKQPCD